MLQQQLENPLAQQLLTGDFVAGDTIVVDYEHGNEAQASGTMIFSRQKLHWYERWRRTIAVLCVFLTETKLRSYSVVLGKKSSKKAELGAIVGLAIDRRRLKLNNSMSTWSWFAPIESTAVKYLAKL